MMNKNFIVTVERHKDGRVVPKSNARPNDAPMITQPISKGSKVGKPTMVPKKI